MQAGIVYAPYMPLFISELIHDPDYQTKRHKALTRMIRFTTTTQILILISMISLVLALPEATSWIIPVSIFTLVVDFFIQGAMLLQKVKLKDQQVDLILENI